MVANYKLAAKCCPYRPRPMSPATNSWPMWIIEASGSYPGLSEPLLGLSNHTPVCNIIRPPLCWSFACSAAFYHIQHHTLNQSWIISSADVAKRRPDLCERKLLYWIRIGPVWQTVIGIAIIIVWVGSEEEVLWVRMWMLDADWYVWHYYTAC